MHVTIKRYQVRWPSLKLAIYGVIHLCPLLRTGCAVRIAPPPPPPPPYSGFGFTAFFSTRDTGRSPGRAEAASVRGILLAVRRLWRRRLLLLAPIASSSLWVPLRRAWLAPSSSLRVSLRWAWLTPSSYPPLRVPLGRAWLAVRRGRVRTAVAAVRGIGLPLGRRLLGVPVGRRGWRSGGRRR